MVSMSAKKMSRLQNNQEGLVSITVSLIIMIIITLVVSSFALIVRREQRRTLDRQLSQQAFYAAEAGIADAQSAIKAGLTDDITECSGPGSFSKVAETINDPSKPSPIYKSEISNNVSYSCVLIDQTLPDYRVDNLNPSDGSYVTSIDSSVNIGQLDISWQRNDNGQITSNPTDHTLVSGMSGPMLRVTIFPGFTKDVSGITQPLSKNDINQGSHTMFLYPNTEATGDNSITYLGSDGGINSTYPRQGQFVDGNCDSSTVDPDRYACNVSITGLGRTSYFVVVQPLYQSAKIIMTPKDSSGSTINLSGGQAEIDVTGKASDVLRRIQVRVPIDGGLSIGDFDGLFPDSAISTTDDLCKLLVLTETTLKDQCDSSPSVTLTGVVPPPSPTPDPDPDPSGNADIGSCDGSPRQPSFCDDPGPPKLWGWTQSYSNWSDNPASEVDRCVWSWGDGHTTELTSGQKGCNYNDQMVHDYSSAGHQNLQDDIIRTNGAIGCRRYSVTLTVYFKPSTRKRPASKTNNREQVPYGTEGKRYCTGKYRLYTP